MTSCYKMKDTTRPRRPDERNGKHYHFVSRDEMEKAIENNFFVEYVFLDGHYFGTSINSIRSVMNSGLTCLLDLEPQVTIKILHEYHLLHVLYYYNSVEQCLVYIYTVTSIHVLHACYCLLLFRQ